MSRIFKINGFNCKGANNNLNYILKCAENSNIMAVFETWAEEWSQPSIQALKRINKTIYSFKTKTNIQTITTNEANKKRGRMSGGLGWIVDTKMDNKIKITYFNSRITGCEILLKNNNSIVNLAVYMPCGKSKSRIH